MASHTSITTTPTVGRIGGVRTASRLVRMSQSAGYPVPRYSIVANLQRLQQQRMANPAAYARFTSLSAFMSQPTAVHSF